MDTVLDQHLAKVAKRFRSYRFAASLLFGWALLLGLGLLGLFQLPSLMANRALPWILLAIAGSIVVIAWLFSRFSFRKTDWIAQQIESRFPTLHQRLITVVERRKGIGTSVPQDFFQLSLLQETLRHAALNDWRQTLSIYKVRLLWLAQLILLASATMVWGTALNRMPTEESASLVDNRLIPTERLSVEPGNSEVEKGSNVVVTAKFSGEVPDEVQLEFGTTSDSNRRLQPLRRNLKDPIFGGVLLSVNADLKYRVTFEGGASAEYSLKVFEYPALVRSDAKIVAPTYAGIPEKLVEDTRRITVPEGSTVTWLIHLNKPVAEAQLVNESGEAVELVQSQEHPLQRTAAMKLQASQRWKLKLKDEEGRNSKIEEELVAKVIPNEPPTIKLVKASDQRVSPLEEVSIGAALKDDFGIKQLGLAYSIDGSEPVEIPLSADSDAVKKVDANHLLALESLKAKPDQLVSYFVWAEDLDSSGNVRRVQSDLFFAEVRPFEEIFREGQSQSGQGQQQQQQPGAGGAAQQSEELAELQKQIIVSLWNILRRETDATRTSSFDSDLKVVSESQQTAIEKLGELSQTATSPESQQIVTRVQLHMEEVMHLLEEASQSSQTTPVKKARNAAQSAYAGLLQLRAREHEIVQSNQSQSQSSSSSAQRNRQQQLDQLELKNDPSRYESQQAAPDSQEQQQAQEVRQAVNRLKELARRQQDLNQELQKLQAELQAADTEEKKQELEEQLKRLREAQEELLRDADELSEKLNEPTDQESMEDARQQMEQARENVRQAAESLAQNNPSEALSAGTRAEREFEQMRDDLRRETAGQFNETMQQMVNQARELNDQQKQLSERAKSEPAPTETPGLRAETPESNIANELKDQSKKLEDLLKQMQETVSNAENTEPLLADKLYDAFRETRQKGVDQNLQQLSQLADQGVEVGRIPETRQLLDNADRGVEDLKQKVETAAETVLGSETESLKRALSELNRASDEINRELKDAVGDELGQPSEGASNENANSTEQRSTSDGAPTGDAPSGDAPLGESSSGNSREEQEPGTDETDRARQNRALGQKSEQPNEQSQPQPGNNPEEGTESEPSRSENANNPQGSGEQSQQSGQQPGSATSESQQGQEGAQPSESSANPGQSESQPGNQSGRARGNRTNNQTGNRGTANNLLDRMADDAGRFAPIAGDDFMEWSDRLRDIEETLDDPELQSRVARVREAARDIRREARKHAADPQWPLVQKLIAEPLQQLRVEVQEELLRKSAERNSLVPIDRDPVPTEFEKAQQKYYENLGSGKR